MSRRKASISEQDYLERIYELIQEKGYARAVDIAGELGISQPSVTSMVQKMAQSGLVNYEKYRGLTLTDEGKTIAENIQIRHKILKQFLSLMGVSAKTQEKDIEGLEHHLSEETISAIRELSTMLEERADFRRELHKTLKKK